MLPIIMEENDCQNSKPYATFVYRRSDDNQLDRIKCDKLASEVKPYDKTIRNGRESDVISANNGNETSEIDITEQHKDRDIKDKIGEVSPNDSLSQNTMHRDEKVYPCDVCGKAFKKKSGLAIHQKIHTGLKPYVCQTCGKGFILKSVLKNHERIHTGEKPYTCTICNKTFTHLSGLSIHKSGVHLKSKIYQCTHCDRSYTDRSALVYHIKASHSGCKPFDCPTCGKSFVTRKVLKNHLRTHTRIKAFACDICDKAFIHNSGLYTHKKAMHADAKLYKCEYCDRTYNRSSSLDYHIRASHTGDKPHKCEICDAAFIQSSYLKKHIRIHHTGSRPYGCDVCGKVFSCGNDRNRHLFVHSDKKRFECGTCGLGFMVKSRLYLHMQETGHISNTIVVNEPDLGADFIEGPNANDLVEVQMVEGNELPSHFGTEPICHIKEETSDDNSISSEVSEDFSNLIDIEKTYIGHDGQYIKKEDGSMEKIED